MALIVATAAPAITASGTGGSSASPLAAAAINSTVTPNGATSGSAHDSANAAPTGTEKAGTAAAQAAYAKLPLRFEANQGQSDPQVKFIAHAGGSTLFLTPGAAVLSLARPAKAAAGPTAPTAKATHPASASAATDVVRMNFVGVDRNAAIEGTTQLAGVTNYLIGNDRSKWHSNVPGYSAVRYRNAYPGIDIVFRGGTQSSPEYDFELVPGADPNAIALDFTGGGTPSIDADGSLVLHPGSGELRQAKPTLYQLVGGKRRVVSGSFVLLGHGRVGFRIGAYDHSKPLVIDPTLDFSTYLGGEGNGVALANGKIFVTGSTANAFDFPVANPIPAGAALQGATDAFVTEFTGDGSQVVYSTYLGGAGDDTGTGIAVSAAGVAAVTGYTTSTDFPVTKDTAVEASASGDFDAFVAELAAGGGALRYSTYLGGSGSDTASAIALDGAGDVDVAGTTTSSDFPTKNGFSTAFLGGFSDVFVTKIDPTAASGTAAMVYSTYLGGGNGDIATSIAVDTANLVYVAGGTYSPDFPTTSNAFQQNCPAPYDPSSCAHEAFVAQLDPSLAGTPSLIYSTLLGAPTTGSGDTNGGGIAVDALGHVFVTGDTTSPNFPTTSTAVASTLRDTADDAFVAELDPSVAGQPSLLYSTYLGGVNAAGTGIALQSSGIVEVTGYTFSADFPTSGSVAPYGGGVDAFVIKLDTTAPSSGGIIYSTLLGGSGFDEPTGIAVDGAGAAVVVGVTSGPKDFPTKRPLRARCWNPVGAACDDGFLARIVPGAPPPLVVSLTSKGSPPSGGTPVLITGSGFTGATAVTFGSTPATSFNVISSSTISAVSPSHADGVVDVTVTGPTGTSLAGPLSRFTYGLGAWTPTLPMNVARYGQTATLLTGPGCSPRCGKVLVAGGYAGAGPTNSAELYDPATSSWSETSSMIEGRADHTATLLSGPNCGVNCGKVLVVAGTSVSYGRLQTAELYDPGTGQWQQTDPMLGQNGRVRHTATLLSGPQCAQTSPPSWCGKVLVAGGRTRLPAPSYMTVYLKTAQLYDPANGTWSAAGDLPYEVGDHTATSLDTANCGSFCGNVLVTGGEAGPSGSSNTNRASLYDPGSNTWIETTSMKAVRVFHTATLLSGPDCGSNCGKVLVAGGSNGDSLNSTELFDPVSKSWSFGPNLTFARLFHTATLLANGRVLLAGGYSKDSPGGQNTALDSAELYDPATSTTTLTGSLITARAQHTATLVSGPGCTPQCGDVVAAGGVTAAVSGTKLASAELYISAAVPAPAVTAVSPSTGPAAGGTVVTLTGTGFTGATAVSFGTTPATSFTVDSDTQITATAPAGTVPVDITVTTPSGTSAVSAADRFTFAAATTVSVSPATLTFTGQAVGQSSAAQTVTLTNGGSTTVTVSSVTLGGAGAGSFVKATDSCTNATVAAGGTCTVGVTYTPTASGTASATLSFTDSASTSPQTVALSGSTTPSTTTVTLTPTTLTFSNQAVGQASAAQTVTLTNGGTTPVTVSKLALAGTNAGFFATNADTCTNATLAPGATCTVGVSFTPSIAGPASATLTFTDTAGNSPRTVTLSGTTVPATATTPTALTTTRIAGENRIATAVAASKKSFPTPGSAKAVVLARADLYPDALAGVPLAAAKTAPLLLTNTSVLDATSKAEIARVLPAGGTVYLLGGTAALAPSVESALSGLGYHPVRLAGTTRFATAVAIAGALGDPTNVFEVTGTNFADAIAAGPAAIAAHGAILLTDGEAFSTPTQAYLAAHPSDFRVAVGGPATRADTGAVAVAGINRFATSAALATRSFPNPTVVGLATGEDFPDALAGGPVVGASGPILLVATGAPLPTEVAAYLAAHGSTVSSLLVFGGTAVVHDDVVTAAQSALKVG